MVRFRELAYVIYVILCLKSETLQKELGSDHDTEEHLTQMKWDTILKDANLVAESSDLSKNESVNLEPLFAFENEPHVNLKSSIKLSESELAHFVEDEVFAAENGNAANSRNPIKSQQTGTGSSITSPNKSENKVPPENTDGKLGVNVPNTSENAHSAMKPMFGQPSSELNKSELHTPIDEQDTPLTDIHDLNSFSRSFIFNPFANPQEQYQNCTTPKNESGNCRYLQHCMIPTIVSSLNQFMDYVCIIEGLFIGVCCPNLPASVVVVQGLKQNTSEEIGNDTECGIATNTRIVGGSKADPKAWPWMVALFSKFRKNFFCGGALINDRYVLTAAHCTFGVIRNEIIARVGEYDFKDDGGTHDDFSVIEIKRHGHYNRRTLQNDIALLKLEKPVIFNEFIKTICFPEEEQSYVGQKGTLAGWGNIKGGGRTSHILQEASFPIISNEQCSKGHGLPISNALICTGAELKDKGACNGDSGGPLMLLDKNNRWKVIGLVSWGRRGCSPEFPTVYTRVSHFLDWLKKHSS